MAIGLNLPRGTKIAFLGHNEKDDNPIWAGVRLIEGQTYTLRGYQRAGAPCHKGDGCTCVPYAVMVEEHFNPISPEIIKKYNAPVDTEWCYPLESFSLVVENQLPEELTTFLTNPNSPVKQDQFDRPLVEAEHDELFRAMEKVLREWRA